MIADNDFEYLCLCFGKYRRDRIQRNSFPRKYKCVCCTRRFEVRDFENFVSSQHYLRKGYVCWGCSLDRKLKLATQTLRHLVSAIPVAERDRNEIYPNEVHVPLQYKSRLPGLGLRDYTELTKLSRVASAFRQKAASSAKNALTPVVGLPAIDTRWALYLWVYPTQTQQTLKQLRRLYRDGCWYPKIRDIPFSHARTARARWAQTAQSPYTKG